MGTTVLEMDDLINRRLPYFHRQALRRLGNVADAEDAVSSMSVDARSCRRCPDSRMSRISRTAP